MREVAKATLFEFQPVEYEISDFDSFEDRKLLLTEKTMEELEKLNEERKFLEIDRRKIKPLNYVGVVKVGNITIEILPKFASEDKKDKIAKNLLKMLEFTPLLNFEEIDYVGLFKEKNSFFEILIAIFAENLLKLLKAKQNFEYVLRCDKLRFLRGKIDLKTHNNPANLHKIPCRFFERQIDNKINRTLKYSCFLMSKAVENRDTYRKLRQIINILDPITIAPISIQEIRNINFNRLNVDFKPFIDFCRIFLENSTLTLQASKLEFFSLLIPMERLFERFIAEVIKRERIYKIFHPEAKMEIQKSIGYFLHRDGQRMVKITPDIIIFSPEEKIILDAKYKLLDPEDLKLGVSQQDLYQIYTYCREFDAEKAILIYPEGFNPIERENQKIPLKMGKSQEIKLFITSIPLYIDLCENWSEFVKELRSALSISK